MLRTTVSEPSPWPSCRFEQEASEPDAPLCAYCGGVEVVEEGEHCSALCAELSANESDDDRRTTEQLDTEH